MGVDPKTALIVESVANENTKNKQYCNYFAITPKLAPRKYPSV
jgi:hypothetical protein